MKTYAQWCYKGYAIELADDGDGDWSLLIDGNQEMLITNVEQPNEELLFEEGKKIVDEQYE
jgi:hypothetical protein